MSEEFLKGLTKEQIDAIKSSGNVLVSAGAGSGKTSVLTKRVLYNLLNGVQLDELLILTFTNNAANEMKERIKNTLSLYEKTKHLVPFVDSANITTFDAYFLYLVKKYSYVFFILSVVFICKETNQLSAFTGKSPAQYLSTGMS